jgi:hypothetical protein
MASKSYTRKRKGGNKWNCNCTLASNPTTKTVIAVPVKKATTATTLQKTVRQRQAAQKVASLKSAKKPTTPTGLKSAKKPTTPTGLNSAKKPTTPTGLNSALAAQSPSMSAQQKGMQALMAKPGMTEAKAKAILSQQSNKKAIAQKIQSRNDGTISSTGAKKQAKKTIKKATKAQKKKSSKGGRKRKTRRVTRKRKSRRLRSKRR